MKNTIKVTISFSFKGVEYSPSSVIDLDAFILGDTNLDAIFQRVASDNKIDYYSYEYEVLESSPKVFSNPTGIAGDFLSDTTFDLEGFKQHQSNLEGLAILQKIVKDTMGIANLEENKALKSALLQAYNAGKASQSSYISGN